MDKVVNLKKHRQMLRRDYLRRYKHDIHSFLESFLESNLVFSLESIISDYKQNLIHSQNTSWDYQDLREVLVEYFEAIYGELLFEAIKKEPWFDERYLSLETLLDKSISTLVLREKQPVQARKRSHLKSV